MNEPLKVPDAAKAAAYAATVGIPTTFGLINTAISAAAPLIVAAELRRQADELHELRQTMRSEDDRSIRSSGLAEAVHKLRTRANELDPQGLTK
jgi:hypothetical protein